MPRPLRSSLGKEGEVDSTNHKTYPRNNHGSTRPREDKPTTPSRELVTEEGLQGLNGPLPEASIGDEGKRPHRRGK